MMAGIGNGELAGVAASVGDVRREPAVESRGSLWVEMKLAYNMM